MPPGDENLSDAGERRGVGKVLLGAWRTTWLAYELDRGTGRYARRLIRLGEVLPLSGFGAVERTREHGKLVFAVFRWGGHMVLQAGRRHWRLDEPGLACEYRLLPDRRSSAFSVRRGDEVLFQCSYGHAFRTLFGRREVEDTVDFETDHFLAHVAGLALPLTDLGTWVDGEAVPVNRRAQVRSTLALLADLDKQRDHERELKIADVPGELFSVWFADAYLPTQAAFRNAFDPGELDLLKHFTALVEAARKELQEVKDLADLQARPAWTCVVEEAGRLLAKLPEVRPGPARG